MDPLYSNSILSALAAVGLASLLWLLAGLLLPRRKSGRVLALIPAEHTAPELEFTLRRLLRDCRGSFARILILDLGLTEEARRRALLLSRQDPCIRLCRREELLPLLNYDKEA